LRELLATLDQCAASRAPLFEPPTAERAALQRRCRTIYWKGPLNATPDNPVLRDIVLIGGGHSHVVVLHMWAMKPLPGARLTLICTDTDTPYSGMLPGYIAGHYTCDDVHIDLRRLAEFAGARYYRDEVIGIDRAAAQGDLPRAAAGQPTTRCRSTSVRRRN
jgi:hypothetical protein